MHGEGLDLVLLQDLPLSRVDVSKTDVDDLGGSEAGLDPLVEGSDVGSLETHEEGDGTSVKVSRVGGERSVDVGVSIDPDQAGVGVLGKSSLLERRERVKTESSRARKPGSRERKPTNRDGSHGERVISSKGKGEMSSLGRLSDESTDLLADLGDGSRVDHLSDVGVLLRLETVSIEKSRREREEIDERKERKEVSLGLRLGSRTSI